MSHCEVVEVRNSADAVGLTCLRTAASKCSDCGAELCESHAETCGMCRAVFCPPCLTFHQEQHPKALAVDSTRPSQGKIAAATHGTVQRLGCNPEETRCVLLTSP